MTKKIFGLILIVVLLSGFCGLVSADDSTAVLPTLKLTVEPAPTMGPLPMTMYTAQLSFMPTTSTTQLVAYFYNITSPMGPIILLGSAPFDRTGKAVLIKHLDPGTYTAQASTVINKIEIKSNTVTYKVP